MLSEDFPNVMPLSLLRMHLIPIVLEHLFIRTGDIIRGIWHHLTISYLDSRIIYNWRSNIANRWNHWFRNDLTWFYILIFCNSETSLKQWQTILSYFVGEINIKYMQFPVFLYYITLLVDYQACVYIIQSLEIPYYIFFIDLYPSVLKTLPERAICSCRAQATCIF